MEQFSNRRAFTLIELLIVIAILGIIAAGIVTALNVTGTIGKANLAKAKTFAASIENDLSINQVGKWSFEEAGGTIFKDTSGYNNNGSCLGDPCPVRKTAQECELGFGRCLNFEGVNDYVDITGVHNALKGANRLSLFVWIKPITSGQSIFSILKVRGEEYILLGFGGKMSVTLFPTGSTKGHIESSINSYTLTDAWHHVGFVWDGTDRIILYLDGSPIASEEPYGAGRFAGGIDGLSFNFALGVVSSDIGIYDKAIRPFGGLIDEVAIYNEALTAYQVQHLYAKGLLQHILTYKGL